MQPVSSLFSMRKVSTAALLLLSVGVLSLYLPMLYTKLFLDTPGKTHLFYSPVTKRFTYTEKIVGPIPEEAAASATDHNVEISYRDQDGSWLTRVAFEKRLPFIYYKNMEMWGLLPLNLEGKLLDKAVIKSHRQVLELKHADITGRRPSAGMYPLLESVPDQVRLTFPEDRFRMTPERMEFVNVLTNRVDEDVSQRFTMALKKSGFVFPARSVHGKFTILKPFDEGVFLVDSAHQVFHLKRKHGNPVAVKTDIGAGVKTKHIKVSENKRKIYYGLLLEENGSLYLISYDNYRLIPLPVPGYDADTMDMKLLFNPLYCTAVYSDEEKIRGVVMDLKYKVLASYSHRMSRANITIKKRMYAALFPFRIEPENNSGKGYLSFSFHVGSPFTLIFTVIYLILWFIP